jgi:hypothetical protein
MNTLCRKTKYALIITLSIAALYAFSVSFRAEVLPTTSSKEASAGDQAVPYEVLDLAPPPSSIAMLVEMSDIIAIGTVGDPWTLATEPAPTLEPELPTEWASDDEGLDLTYMPIEVEETLLDDGTIANGGPLIWTIYGHEQDLTAEEKELGAWPERGMRFLFFFALDPGIENPHTNTYAATRYESLIIDGSQVLYRDAEPVAFAAGMSPAQFIDAVTAEIASQHPPTPTPIP